MDAKKNISKAVEANEQEKVEVIKKEPKIEVKKEVPKKKDKIKKVKKISKSIISKVKSFTTKKEKK